MQRFDDDESWDDNDDEPSLVPCPFCRKEMLEDAPQCPACGNYVSDADRSAALKPGWAVLVIVGLLIAAFVMSAVF